MKTNMMIKAMAALSEIILEGIDEEKGSPSGVIYAALIGQITIEQYNGAIRALKHVDAIKDCGGHLLERGKNYDDVKTKMHNLAQ